MSLEVDIRHRLGAFALDARFAVDRPGVTALFGPSGAGKSTTIDAIAGLLRPDEGRIRINGDTVLDTASGLCVPARRRRVGYVFQDARLFPHLSVRGNLLFGARRSPGGIDRAALARMVELLGIGELLGRRPVGLSGGERQRVALGRALLARPRILLLDEPLAALDAGRKAEILPCFEALRHEAGIPIVYVSHAIDEVTRLADSLVLLSGGRVAAQGTVPEIMARLDLFPITGRFEAGAVIDGTIERHDDDGLCAVAFDAGRLWVPRIEAPVGTPVRLRVRARDVILATSEPGAISANNVIPGTVADIRLDAAPFIDVRIACGAAALIARITHRSLARLDLAPGRPVFAVVKSVSVERQVASAGRG